MGKPILHINAATSDHERLKHAAQENACFDSHPSKKAYHLNWDLRPRDQLKELGPVSLTMNKHIQIDKLVNNLKTETGNYFTRDACLGTTVASPPLHHSAQKAQLKSAVDRLRH